MKDGENTEALPLMKELLTYGRKYCKIVILEGIMYADWYKPLFELAVQLYGTNILAYYFDLPFEETLRRHQTKPNCNEFGEEAMCRWWRDKDFSEVLNEHVITAEKDIQTIIREINTQTLEHSRPFAISGCRRIMTIENKANYESMPYEEDVLYIFCHGYLTPKEVRFLKQLCMIVPKDCEFYHWGDMDFGGISIFQFIKEKVFPDLKPYRMDVKDFEEALANGAGIPMKDSTRKKLERKEAGLLTGLKAEILRTGMTIEQERLL